MAEKFNKFQYSAPVCPGHREVTVEVGSKSNPVSSTQVSRLGEPGA